MAINAGAYARALKPGVNTWFGLEYADYPQVWDKIFEVFGSTMNFEEDVNARGFGLAMVKPESQPFNYDTVQQGFTQKYTHVTYGLGYVISREAIEDNLYVKLAQARTKSLAYSMRQTKENVCANVLNRANNSAYKLADGLSLANSAHILTGGGTLSNVLATAANLSEASLEQMLISIRLMVDDANMHIGAQGD